MKIVHLIHFITINLLQYINRGKFYSEELKILLDTKFFVLNLYFDYYHLPPKI